MGVRGEIFSNRVILPNRTYFFNVKENRMGDLYLNIVESKNRDNGGFDRQSVILFADDLQAFLGGFEESLKVMEKAVREKKHSGYAKREGGRRESKTRVIVKNKKENKPQDFTQRSRRNKDHKERTGGYRPKAMRDFHDKTTDKNP
jgi:hypothetical protein